MSEGMESAGDDILLICPNCNTAIDKSPREIEFTRFLSDALKKHPNYFDVRSSSVLEAASRRFRIDILAQQKRDGGNKTLLIECKTPQALASRPIAEVVVQLQTYRELLGTGEMILAVPASLPSHDISALASVGIELWDLDYLIEHFSARLNKSESSYYRALLVTQRARRSKLSRERQLISDLQACRTGREDWRLYQSLIGEILECLFTPALNKPIFEQSDMARANRRDFILPNYADSGFWASMRGMYKADYVVVDAKNSSRNLKKTDVLQIANYLKPCGAGLFGMIMCRKGGDQAGCLHTVREQWQQHSKLILILNDDDIENMLIARSEGRGPEDLVILKIQQLRLSI